MANSKVKVISGIISLGVMLAMVVGIFSVVNNIKKSENNMINLNEAKDENEDINEAEADEYVQVGEKPTIGDDDIINANARASMSNDGDGSEKIVTEATTGTDDANVANNQVEKQEETATVPETLSSAEVMAKAISSLTFEKGSDIVWPVSGDVTLGYNMDSTVYFKSLGLYKCSPGVIIAAEQGTNVAAAAKGIVVKVVDSEETKTTVTIAVGSGYEITTGLLDNVNVKEGDSVEMGQLLGTVSEPTAYYKEEGPGIYFAMTKDGVPVNPMEYLGE